MELARRNWMLEKPLSLLAFSFLIYPLPLTQLVRLPGITYHLPWSACVTYRALCHAIGHQVLTTQLLHRGAEDVPRGGKYFNHVPLLTVLIYFPPKVITW